MALAAVPKFYKSVIDDVISQMREVFLDDGVDDQVIQDIKLTWEKKIVESRAVELEPKPQPNEAPNTSSSTTNNASSTNNSSSSNQKTSEKNKSTSQQTAQGQTTSVITSNPNHVQKNGTTNNKNNKNNKNNGNNNNTNMVRIKTEIDDNSSATLIQPQSIINIQKAVANPTVMGKTQNSLTNTTNIIGQPAAQLAQPGQLAPGTVAHSQAEQMFRTSAIISNNSIGLATPPGSVPGTNATAAPMLQVPSINKRHLSQTGKNMQQRFNSSNNLHNNINNNAVAIVTLNSTSSSSATNSSNSTTASTIDNSGFRVSSRSAFIPVDNYNHNNQNNKDNNENNNNNNSGSNNNKTNTNNDDTNKKRLRVENKSEMDKDKNYLMNTIIKTEPGLIHSPYDRLNSLADAALSINNNYVPHHQLQLLQQQQPPPHQSMPINLSLSGQQQQQQSSLILPQQRNHHSTAGRMNMTDTGPVVSHINTDNLRLFSDPSYLACHYPFPTPNSFRLNNPSTGVGVCLPPGASSSTNIGHIPTNILPTSSSSSISQINTNHGGSGGVGGNTTFGMNHKEVKFQPSGIIQGQKVVFLPNQLMAQPGTGQFILNSELINSFNMPASGIIAPTGHQVISHPGAIQYIRSGIPVPGQPTVIPAMIRGPIVQTSLPSSVVATQSSQTGGQQLNNRVAQMDGPMNHENDSSDEDDDEDDYRDNDDDIDENDDEMNDEENEGGVEEEPLNSEDDVSDEDPVELFETDNVVVCQYDKITRSRNKWKFHFKDGIMNLQGKDYVFSRAVGDAEW